MTSSAMRAVVSEDSEWIGYGLGPRFRLRRVSTVDGSKRSLKLMPSPLDTDNTYICCFDVPQTDFEVEVDNVFSAANIEYSFQYSPVFVKRYHLRRGQRLTHKAIDISGKQLVFKRNDGSQTIDDVIRLRANRYGLTVEETLILCSRIGVAVKTEKPFEIKGQQMRVNIHYTYRNGGSLMKQDFDLKIGSDNTVGDMKRLIDELEGIAYKDQKLFKVKYLFDSQTLKECDIDDNCTVYLVPKVIGGLDVSDLDMNEIYGQRGLVCFMGPTDQSAYPIIRGFEADDTRRVIPFTLELRFTGPQE
ncbi:unnamed protein product [Medioppia subpectinata]|uniref:Ubiquitin-like domain-containing protein n=1 Tax=Medioppia subpectinata TaxID=1979941 RepID=A0A7R9QCL9_9ACAR|nr:unnamed protein product [Medioppia subpectinata]CAG2118466.1 unnamed protein product [Medioppia subpectinata]